MISDLEEKVRIWKGRNAVIQIIKDHLIQELIEHHNLWQSPHEIEYFVRDALTDDLHIGLDLDDTIGIGILAIEIQKQYYESRNIDFA